MAHLDLRKKITFVAFSFKESPLGTIPLTTTSFSSVLISRVRLIMSSAISSGDFSERRSFAPYVILTNQGGISAMVLYSLSYNRSSLLETNVNFIVRGYYFPHFERGFISFIVESPHIVIVRFFIFGVFVFSS